MARLVPNLKNQMLVFSSKKNRAQIIKSYMLIRLLGQALPANNKDLRRRSMKEENRSQLKVSCLSSFRM